MKIRNGFVSNSSTSSFIVFGVLINDPDAFLKKAFGEPKTIKTPGCNHNIDRETVMFCPECGKSVWVAKVEKRRDIGRYETEILKQFGLDTVTWNEEVYLGKNLKYWEEGLMPAQKIQKLNEVMLKLNELFPNEKADFYHDAASEG